MISYSPNYQSNVAKHMKDLQLQAQLLRPLQMTGVPTSDVINPQFSQADQVLLMLETILSKKDARAVFSEFGKFQNGMEALYLSLPDFVREHQGTLYTPVQFMESFKRATGFTPTASHIEQVEQQQQPVAPVLAGPRVPRPSMEAPDLSAIASQYLQMLQMAEQQNSIFGARQWDRAMKANEDMLASQYEGTQRAQALAGHHDILRSVLAQLAEQQESGRNVNFIIQHVRAFMSLVGAGMSYGRELKRRKWGINGGSCCGSGFAVGGAMSGGMMRQIGNSNYRLLGSGVGSMTYTPSSYTARM